MKVKDIKDIQSLLTGNVAEITEAIAELSRIDGRRTRHERDLITRSITNLHKAKISLEAARDSFEARTDGLED